MNSKYFSIIIIILLYGNLSVPVMGQDIAAQFKCSPCGCVDDHKVFNAPGNCPSCGMTLLDLNNAHPDQKFDNIMPGELCEFIDQHGNLVFLDVRSVQEFDGTTSSLGHLKNAINIPISNIEERIGELEKYKDKDILVYCSISARSPRVSKILADNGFTKITNLFGGLNLLKDTEINCKNKLLVTQ